MSKKSIITIGLMSGTSMDGIDAVLYEISTKNKILKRSNTDYHPTAKNLLKLGEFISTFKKGKIEQDLFENCSEFIEKFLENQIPSVNEEVVNQQINEYKSYLENITELNFSKTDEITLSVIIKLSTFLHYFVVKSLLENEQVEVDLIGYHGQTWYHNPGLGISLQIGDGKLLSELTSISVVNDFRSEDVLNGGQGAPLAPLYHAFLLSQLSLLPAAIVNCGGISNISVIFDKENVIGYDAGPGNSLIDRFVKFKTNGLEEMDKNGEYAKNGTVDEEMFELLKEKACTVEIDNKTVNFVDLPIPKSLDISNLHLLPELKKMSILDGCATLSKFSIWCLIESFEIATKSIEEKIIYKSVKEKNHSFKEIGTWILAGGGWLNQSLTNNFKVMLKEKLGTGLVVLNVDEIEGLSSDTLEAEIFAKFAWDVLNNVPTSVPSTTGVCRPISGGKVYFSESPTENVQNTPKYKEK
jgi:anhydro-N-acetylmuramic acid kinase